MEYNVRKNGVVVAIRIFTGENGVSNMAELAFAYGGTVIIDWNNVVERAKYSEGINGYTFVYDERERRPFQDFVK